MNYNYTTQRDLRAAFWDTFPDMPRKPISGYRGGVLIRNYRTDTRCAFCDWIDSLARDGQISEALTQRATL